MTIPPHLAHALDLIGVRNPPKPRPTPHDPAKRRGSTRGEMKMRYRKYYLPHVVENVPIEWAFDENGKLRPKIRQYVNQGVVRIIAGPNAVHAVIDVQRPYYCPIQ